MWRARVFTLFPQMFPGPLALSLSGRALRQGRWHLQVIDIKAFCVGYHDVDDKPYGGGAGMVLRADVVDRALASVLLRGQQKERLVHLSPRGVPLTQERLQELATGDGVSLVCSHYEGLDQRVIEAWQMEEISLGDYVLSGGEVAALVLLDGCVRLLAGVVNKQASLTEESFVYDGSVLLEHPQYTQPLSWQNRKVPSVLLSGDHQAIRMLAAPTSRTDNPQPPPGLVAGV